MTFDPLLDFRSFPFSHLGQELTVYRKGEGPAVIVMHEVAGISIEVIRFARKVVDAGFTVFTPHLFGIFGTETNEANRARELRSSASAANGTFSRRTARAQSPIGCERSLRMCMRRLAARAWAPLACASPAISR